MAKVFLSIVGVGYLVLAAWCALLPKQTSQAVGFELKPGTGQSEFLTVYGGLELALGVIFLWPLFAGESLNATLRICVIVHACLVLFRTAGFFLFTGIETTTYILAAVEWAILLAAAALWWRTAA